MALKSNHINISAPAKIHLLGEHAAVYGKPALLNSVELRVKVTISSSSKPCDLNIVKIIEPIIKKEYKIEEVPYYQLVIDSKIPIGSGLGSSAAVSAACIAAILSFLKIKWDKEVVNNLAYEAEKVFNGNPSGGDNSAVVFGGLLWFQKISVDEKIIKPLPYSVAKNLSSNFVLIYSGKPVETTAQMVAIVRELSQKNKEVVDSFLEDQEKLTNELVDVVKNGDEKKFIEIIRLGERNLEKIGVVSDYVASIIRDIEKAGGAAKISGGGGKTKGTGMLLTYHKDPKVLINIAKRYNLKYFRADLGMEGLKIE